MYTLEMFGGELLITFHKRTMAKLIEEEAISHALNVETRNGVSQVLADNFATFWSRTKDVVLNDGQAEKDLSQDARDFFNFWRANFRKTDYKDIFSTFIESCQLDVNNEWLAVYQDSAKLESGRVSDPELQNADTLPDDVLNDEDVKKNDESLEPIKEAS